MMENKREIQERPSVKELWVPLSGAIAQQKNVETIANNVANANTPGFKKDQVVFREYLSAYEKGTDLDLPNKEWAPEDFYRTYGAEKAQVEVDRSYTKYEQGPLIPSRNPFDIGINGPGFFEVLTPNGIRYTRRGTFSLNGEGKLVTNKGYFVLKKDNLEAEEGVQNNNSLIDPKERNITLPKGRMSVNQQGDVSVNDRLITRLSLVEFKNPHDLIKEGNGLFINRDARNMIGKEIKSTLHQGLIEQSNVNAIEEMSALIKAHRQFETLQKVIKTYDNIAGKASNELARF